MCETKHVGGFQELTGSFLVEKLLFGHEEIVHAIHFTWTRLSCGCGYRQPDFRMLLAHAPENSAFAYTCRSAKDDQTAMLGVGHCFLTLY